jgi:hypothetical protein
MPGPYFSPEALAPYVEQAPYAEQAQSAAAPAPRSAVYNPDELRWLRWLGLIGSNVFDAGTTIAALQRPRTREANPWLRRIASKPLALLALKGGVGLLQNLLLDKLANDHERTANAVGLGVTGVNTAIGVRNLHQGPGP